MPGGSTGTPVGSAATALNAHSLAEIEREVAQRLGPFEHLRASGGTGNQATVPALQSTLDLGGYEDLWILRRGLKEDGTAVPDFVAGDRQRVVAIYTPGTGTLEPDRPWTSAVVDGELLELHHLNPAYELRPSVLAGLKRCYFVERVSVTLAGAAAERDLTAAVAWITRPGQVRDVGYATTDATYLPAGLLWFRPFQKGNAVWLAGSPDAYPYALLVTALRPVWTYVDTGAGFTDSATGPTADAHRVSAPLEYAAAAGHAEVWRRFRRRVAPLALPRDDQPALHPGPQEVAAEFTRQSLLAVPPTSGRIRLAPPVGSRAAAYEVVNA